MYWLKELFLRLHAAFRGNQIDREIDDEMRFHIQMRTQENINAGMTSEEARKDARRRFGNLTYLREQSRDIRGSGLIEILFQDLRYGLRILIKNPTFTAVAVIALALGIGANTAIFSLVNGVLLRPLPFADSSRVMRLQETSVKANGLVQASPPNFVDWRDQNQVFEHIAAFHGQGFTLTGAGEPERILGVRASASFFPLLGIKPILGRTFADEEDRVGHERVVVLSYGFWQRRFGADPDIISKPITLNGKSYTVVGVMPPDFYYPRDESLALWTPLAPDGNPSRGSHYLTVIARLKQGVATEQAQAEMTTIAAALEQQHPGTNAGNGVFVSSLHEETVKEVRPALLILLGAVGFVLLIACANVANLQLARGASRHREISIRMALGASRPRVIRQLLTESVLLYLLGGALGLLFALWAVGLIVRLSPAGVPRLQEVHIDVQVLGFTLAVSFLAGILSGLAPALQGTKADLNESLKEGGRGSAGGARRKGIRNLLIISEVAISLVLLIGAGLMVKSFQRLLNVEPGFDPEGVVTMSVSLPDTKYVEKQQVAEFYHQLLNRVEAIPGVKSTGLISHLPLTGTEWTNSFTIEGRAAREPGDSFYSDLRWTSPGYFRTMGITLIEGREFTEMDGAGTTGVVIINQAMAHRFFQNEEALGKRLIIHYNQDIAAEIIGIVQDARQGLDTDPAPEMYVSYLQTPVRSLTLAVRTPEDVSRIVPAVRSQVLALDKDQPISNVSTMDEVLSASIAQRKFNMLLLVIFSGVAMALAAIGLYGVMSYSVVQRRHEIAIRIALGARRRDVIQLVVGQAAVLTGLGMTIGLLGALTLTRVLKNLLFNVSFTDTATFVGVSLSLLAVALAASYLPARRASIIDPLAALKAE